MLCPFPRKLFLEVSEINLNIETHLLILLRKFVTIKGRKENSTPCDRFKCMLVGLTSGRAFTFSLICATIKRLALSALTLLSH